MKEFLEIMLCMFATYGFYRMIHAVKVLCSQRVRVVLALRADGQTEEKGFERKYSKVASAALNTDNAESEPVVLCDDEQSAKRLRDAGYAVYIRMP